MKPRILTCITAIVLLAFLQSCGRLSSFEQQVQIQSHAWQYQQQPELQFTITDTTSYYNVMVALRHTDAYAYRNIWLLISTKQPGDSSFRTERFELTLQHPDGRWIGTGLGDIWEVRYPLFSRIRFTRAGTYTIRLQQTMRDNPLLHVMNAGIRIEKANS